MTTPRCYDLHGDDRTRTPHHHVEAAPGSRQSLPASGDTGQESATAPERSRERAGMVPDAAVQAALAGAIAHQKRARQPLWTSPSTGQVRAMLEAAAPLIAAAERERADRAEVKLAAIRELESSPGWLTPSEVQRKVLAIIGGEQEAEAVATLAVRMHLPAVRTALEAAVAGAEYEALALPYKAALEALESCEEGP